MDLQREKIVFSTLFAESDDYLPLLIDNFLLHAPKSGHLMVSLGAGARSRSIPPLPDRVTVFEGSARRTKWGHTLLDAHMEAFLKYVEVYGPASYFCTLASNSLFFRAIDFESVLAEMDRPKHLDFVDVDNLPDLWQWPNVQQVPAVVDALKKIGLRKLCWNQIEGLVSTWDNWRLLALTRSTLLAAGETIPQGVNISFEEMIPGSFFAGVGDGKFANVCRNYWDRFLSTGDGGVVFDDLFDDHPSHISMLKWFDRSGASPETLAVSTKVGQAVVGSLTVADSSNALGIAALFRKASDKIIDAMKFNVALEENLGAVDSDGVSFVAPGSYCAFPIGADVDDLPRSNMYVYSDATGTPCEISIRRDAQTAIHWTCKGDLLELNRVQAHVYLYMGRVGSYSSAVKVEGLMSDKGVVFAIGAPHIPVTKPILIDKAKSYYIAPAGAIGDAVYFGFPICAGSGSVSVEFSERASI